MMRRIEPSDVNVNNMGNTDGVDRRAIDPNATVTVNAIFLKRTLGTAYDAVWPKMKSPRPSI